MRRRRRRSIGWSRRTAVRSIEGGKLDVQRDEPLRAELADFVDAVRDRREPGVSGRAGRDALALATQVAEAMEASAV